MAWPVYSHRFLHNSQAAGWVYYYVPDGMRVVIKKVSALHLGVAGSEVQLRVHGQLVWRYLFRVQDDVKTDDLMAVAYEHEEIALYVADAATFATIWGYLLADPAHESGPPAGPAQDPLPLSPPLEYPVPV